MAKTGFRLRGFPAQVLLLVALPVMVLIVPQGTVERSMVPEVVFIGYMAVGVLLTLLASSGRVDINKLHPLLFLFLAYFLVGNPLWSMLSGNATGRVLMTSLPFVMLALFYVFALARLNAEHVTALVRSVIVSGLLLALVVVGNFFLGDTSSTAMRSTGIEGNRTLTLPLLPVGAVMCTCFAFCARGGAGQRRASVGALLMILAIVMTVTRAMLLAYLIGVIVAGFMLFHFGSPAVRRRIFFRGLGGLVLSLLLVAPLMAQWLSRIDPSNEGDLGTILGRIDEYTAFAEAFLRSPIVGEGMGYLVTYPSDFDWTLRDSGITVCHSHLFFLAGTTGIVGMLLYYLLLAVALLSIWRQARELRGDAEGLCILAGLTGATVSGLAFTLTSTTFTTLSYNLFLAIVIYASKVRWVRS